jgi:hypothetical protein
MVLYVAGLYVLSIACDERQVLALFILKAYLPAGQEFWSRLDVFEPWVLVRSFELPTYHVLKAVVGDNVVMRALVFDRYSFLHETSLFELVAVDQRATETALLIGSKALCKIGVNFARGIGLAGKCSLIGGVFVFVIRVVHVFTSLGDGQSCTFLALALCTARGVQGRFLFLGL